MGKKSIQKICLVFLLIAIVNTDSLANRRKPAKDWVRAGELGPKPKRITDAFPLSDQTNKDKWIKFEFMSDEFEDTKLDPSKWYPTNPRWLGRQPAYFYPDNVKVSDGKLHLTMRKQEVPEMPKDKGYHTYTSAAVQSKTKVKHGYFEVMCKPMKSHGSSSFWFYDNTPELWTEIETVATIQSYFDVFWFKMPIFQHRNLNLCWRLSKCLDQANM